MYTNIIYACTSVKTGSPGFFFAPGFGVYFPALSTPGPGKLRIPGLDLPLPVLRDETPGSRSREQNREYGTGRIFRDSWPF